MDPVATTRYGAVRGSQMEGITTFKGIPYAAPPCGQQRFRPAQPPAPWDGVRDALHFGPTAPKPGYCPPFDVLLPEPTPSPPTAILAGRVTTSRGGRRCASTSPRR